MQLFDEYHKEAIFLSIPLLMIAGYVRYTKRQKNLAGAPLNLKYSFSVIVMLLLIWGFAGALFGALFAGLYEVLFTLNWPNEQLLMSAIAVAAMTTSAFYSAMAVALVGTMAGVLASISYLIATGLNIEFTTLVSIAGSAGIVAGGCYAWMVTNGSHPLAEIVTGLIAGLLAGGTLIIIFTLTSWPMDPFILAMLAIVLVGTFFQISNPWIIRYTASWLPVIFAAPLVAGLIATVVGASIWIMGETTTTLLNPRIPSTFGQVLSKVPSGLLGGLLGGTFTGLLLQLLGYHPEEIFPNSRPMRHKINHRDHDK